MKYQWTKEQKSVLERIPLSFDPFGEMSEDNLFEFEEKVADFFQKYGGAGGDINETGLICEQILDIVTDY
jgi:hypothetical protein